MTIDRSDPRLLQAAALSESEFVGTLVVHPDSDTGEMLEVYRMESPWDRLPDQPLIEPRTGYTLRYIPKQRLEPLVFLVFEGGLVGAFESDTLTIHFDHRGKKLSRELILAGFAQAPWNNKQDRKVTEAGEAALRSAYKFATEVASKPA